MVGFFVGINMDKQMEKLCNYLKAFGFNNYTLQGADTRLVYNFNTDDTTYSVAYIIQTPYTLYLDTSSMCTTRKCEHEFLKVLGSIYKFKVEANTELYELGDCDEEVTPLC